MTVVVLPRPGSGGPWPAKLEDPGSDPPGIPEALDHGKVPYERTVKD